MYNYADQKAVAYARYSCHNQTEQSIEGQLRDIHEFAKRENITIVNEYIDRAISGTKDDRPAFQRMLKDAARHQFTLVLVWKLDRFSRDRYASAVHKNYLKKYGVKVVSVMENISDNPEGVILESVLEGMAEYYSKDLSEKVKRGQRETVLKGCFPGGHVPYGYVLRDSHLVADPATAPVVKEVFERYSKGERSADILSDFEKRGILFNKGRPFHFSTISSITSNPTYTGSFHYNGIVVDGCAEPIVSRALFDAAVARRNLNRQAPAAGRKPGVRFLLLGKIFCGECGTNMAGDSGRGNGGNYHYYSCRHKKNHKQCKSRSYRKDEIEYAVCKVISDFLLNRNRRSMEIMADAIAAAYHASDYDLSDIRDMENQMQKLDSDLDRLVDSLMTMPESTRPRIASRMEKLEAQRHDLEVRLSKRRLEYSDEFSKDDFMHFLQRTVLDVDEETNQVFIIEKFLNCVYVYDDGRMVIYLNHFDGLPHFYDLEEGKRMPDKDKWKEGVNVFNAQTASNYKGPPDFSVGSSLIKYTPPNAGKAEPQLPHLLFLHGMLGILVWQQKGPQQKKIGRR